MWSALAIPPITSPAPRLMSISYRDFGAFHWCAPQWRCQPLQRRQHTWCPYIFNFGEFRSCVQHWSFLLLIRPPLLRVWCPSHFRKKKLKTSARFTDVSNNGGPNSNNAGATHGVHLRLISASFAHVHRNGDASNYFVSTALGVHVILLLRRDSLLYMILALPSVVTLSHHLVSVSFFW